VDILELRKFLKHHWQSSQTPKSMVSTGGSSGVGCSSPDATNLACVKPDPDACFLPDLSNPIKKELQDVLDLSFDASDASRRTHGTPVGTRQIQEGGKEVFLILDSDSEGEDSVALPSLRDGDDGMSSDTVVGDFGGFDSDSDHDVPVEVNYSDSDIDPMSDIEVEWHQTLWLDEGLTSHHVSNKPCKVTRQRSVERVEYLNDLPSYWPIPEVYVAYVLDLSDPKFDIKNKDGDLLPVDALICDKASKLGFN
jgi:hypothetical protein